ncbi:MAG: hypothetical protein ACHQ49_12745 [Elusimicrobiota bacterium]
MKPPATRVLAAFLLSTAPCCRSQGIDLAAQLFKNPGQYLPDAASVFRARGYDSRSLKEIPASPKVFILGTDAYSRAAFAEIKTTIKDPTLKSLSLDNPEHSFAFPYRGSCFVKLTERGADEKEFTASWTGIPVEFIERTDVSLKGEELGMALHELVHCSQPKGIAAALGENEADMAFLRAQPISGDADLVRQTMQLRALFVLNTGIQGSGRTFSPSATFYPSALSFDAVLRGAAPLDGEQAAQAYNLLKNTMAMILGYQMQVAGGFKAGTPHFVKIATAVKSFIAFERIRKPDDPQEKLAVRAAELYLDGLNHFLPVLAGSLDETYGRIDFPQ